MATGPEFELISRMRERIARARAPAGAHVVRGSGDDAAISSPPGVTATSVDAIVDGVHFRRSTHPPRTIGTKALASALSDLAAMGAAPGEAYVQVGLPPDLTESDVMEIADGLGEVAAATGVAVVGGDLVRSPVLFLALTVVGHASGDDRLVGRDGARVGDLVLLSGGVGGAAAGLVLLDQPDMTKHLVGGVADALVRRQQCPTALLDQGRALAAAGATSMIDVSDGLGADAGHIAKASGVRLELEVGPANLEEGVAEVAKARGQDPLEFATAGGEDYELLATVPQENESDALEALRAAGSPGPAVIGRVAGGSGAELRDPSGRALPSGGWDQRGSPARGGPTSSA